MPDCEIPGCRKGTPLGEPVCVGCRNRWRRSGLAFEDFAAAPRPGTYHRSDGQFLRRVPSCQRPPRLVTHGLCTTHGSRWLTSSEPTVEDFLRNSPQTGLPGFGPCDVASCYRLRGSERTIYCEFHRGRLNRERRLGTFCGDEERWRLTTPAVAVNREASLRGLPDRLVAAILYCLQVRTAREVKTRDHRIRHISDQLRLFQVPSLETLEDADLVRAGLVDDLRMIIRGAQTSLRRRGGDSGDRTSQGHLGPVRLRPPRHSQLQPDPSAASPRGGQGLGLRRTPAPPRSQRRRLHAEHDSRYGTALREPASSTRR